MNKIIILVFLLIIHTTGIAQKTQTNKNKVSFRKQNVSISKEQINQLKNGALLIRLKTKMNSIAALKKIGKNKLAAKVEKNQADYNLSIISAFRANFNFCPTYFFFSGFSTNIRERQFNKVVFLNDSLLPDTTLKFKKTSFLTAEFGTIQQDTAKYFSHYSYEPNAKLSVKRVKNYYGGPNMGFAALIINSDKFVQLRRPFPYYVRTFESLPIERSVNKAVRKMNKKLYKYYRQRN